MSYFWGVARNPSSAERPQPAMAADHGGGDPVQMHRLAAELAPMVGVWKRLIAQHTPNRSGRCRTCTKGDSGMPPTPWPCPVYGIAEMARRCHDRDQRGA
jgi:hypothetical protein